MAKIQVKPFRPVNPTPVSLVTSVDSAGRPNIITLAETYNLSISNPVVVGLGIAPGRYSYGLIQACQEFTVNLPTADLVEKVDRCGTTSGREIDKFAAFGLTPAPAAVVKPPLIVECPINMECRLTNIHRMGDHDLFVGEVVAQHVDANALDAAGRIVVEKLNLLAYAFGEYWALGRRLERHGYSLRRAESDWDDDAAF